MCVDPIDRKAVRRQELQRAAAFDRLQGTNPGVEMLSRQFALQRAHAARPERAPVPRLCRFASSCIHGSSCPMERWAGEKGGASLAVLHGIVDTLSACCVPFPPFFPRDQRLWSRSYETHLSTEQA